jgi:hypothetical protein
MFTLRSLSLSSRLGLGLAIAALAISTVAAPLSASAQENILLDDSNGYAPMAQKENGATTTPQQPDKLPTLTIPMKADLQVTARGKTQEGATTKYHFVIKNNGPANAPQVVGYREAQTKALIGDGFALTDNTYFNFGLNAGQEKVVTVSCTPQAGYYCSQGSALVFMNNMADPDFSNDIAVIH